MRPGITLLAGILLGCTSPSTDPAEIVAGSESRVEVRSGDTFTLAPGQRAMVRGAGLEIRFIEVAADSRCPLDVTCIWEGDAEVTVETAQGSVERSFVLHTAGAPTSSRPAELDGYTLELVGLEPLPRSDEAIPQASYRATLRVLESPG